MKIINRLAAAAAAATLALTLTACGGGDTKGQQTPTSSQSQTDNSLPKDEVVRNHLITNGWAVEDVSMACVKTNTLEGTWQLNCGVIFDDECRQHFLVNMNDAKTKVEEYAFGKKVDAYTLTAHGNMNPQGGVTPPMCR